MLLWKSASTAAGACTWKGQVLASLYEFSALPPCLSFPIMQKRMGLPLEDSLELSGGLCSALHCSLQRSRGSRSWRIGAEGKLRIDCSSGHGLSPDSSV